MSETIVTENSPVEKNEETEGTIPVGESAVKLEAIEAESENVEKLVPTCTVDSEADANNRSGVSGEQTAGVNDSLFEPSLEMMVNDFDDERTLEEEEALAAAETDDPNAELDSLQRVSIDSLILRPFSLLASHLVVGNLFRISGDFYTHTFGECQSSEHMLMT